MKVHSVHRASFTVFLVIALSLYFLAALRAASYYYYGNLSIEQLMKAAEGGAPKAQYVLGIKYYRGEGVARDYSEAVSWYNKAAEKGDADAIYQIARLYRDG